MREIKQTSSLCAECLRELPARVVERDGAVFLRKRCPDHGEQEALLASDATFYYEGGPIGACCAPGDEGSASDGAPSPLQLGSSCSLILEVTEHCNLSCPTCFTASSPELSDRLSVDEIVAQLSRLVARGHRADLVQLSGGEPTTHPDIEEIIERCFAAGAGRIYLNTNGVRLGKEPDFAERLGRWSDRLHIYLQYDGQRADTYAAIRGARGLGALKRRAIEHLEAAGLYVLPVMTVTRGINLDEIGAVIDAALAHHPHINGLMLQPAMYAGRYLNEQTPRRVTVGEVAAEVERQTDGRLTRADFGPIPCGDPNCFSLAVAMVNDGRLLPISRYFPPHDSWRDPAVQSRLERIAGHMPQVMLEAMHDDDELLDELFDVLAAPDSAGALDWRRLFIVGIKPFMDAGCYDQQRVDACCTHVVDRSGEPVSLCEYNARRRPRGEL